MSFDQVSAQAAFADELGVKFPLLSDPDHFIAKSYGVGAILGRDSRVTFLIDPQGVIRKVWPTVSPAKHATEVLETLRSLQAK